MQLELHAFPTRRSSDLAARIFFEQESGDSGDIGRGVGRAGVADRAELRTAAAIQIATSDGGDQHVQDRKSTRLNSSHLVSSYAVFCLIKKKNRYKAEIA